MSKIDCAKDAIADAIENRSESKLPKDKGLDYAMELLYEFESKPEPTEFVYQFACTKQYLVNLITIIRDGPNSFNASEPVMMHLNTLFARLVKDAEIIDRLTAEFASSNNIREAEKKILIAEVEKNARLTAENKAKDKEIKRLKKCIQQYDIREFTKRSSI